jgi:hypothetical protein
VTRIVTARAEETPAMLLPPITLAVVDGLAVYPAQPSLEDKTEGRTDALTARRTDSATYILQRAGGYVLPAIDVRWWNASEGRVETAHLDAVPMQVAVNPAAEAGSPTPGRRWNWMAIVDLVADHWIAAILALAALVALCWIVRPPYARLPLATGSAANPISGPNDIRSIGCGVPPVAAMRKRPISRCSTGCNVSARPPRSIP